LIPDDIKRLISMGYEVKVTRGAGEKSGFNDEAYEKAGAVLVSSNEAGYEGSEIILRIMKPESIQGIPSGALHLSYLDPFNEKELLNDFAKSGVQAVSLEMIPRTTLAQKMDVQSSQTSLAGYTAVVNAAAKLPKILPMMVTPLGTIQPQECSSSVSALQVFRLSQQLSVSVLELTLSILVPSLKNR
jgi:NAD(P) transhydrogenase subunit alpha